VLVLEKCACDAEPGSSRRTWARVMGASSSERAASVRDAVALTVLRLASAQTRRAAAGGLDRRRGHRCRRRPRMLSCSQVGSVEAAGCEFGISDGHSNGPFLLVMFRLVSV
jgi:hypothetical protein